MDFKSQPLGSDIGGNKTYYKRIIAKMVNATNKLNGSMIWRVIEGLLIAGIVGGITMYGTIRVMETRLDSLCGTVNKMEMMIGRFNENLFESQKDRIMIRARLETIDERLRLHVENGGDGSDRERNKKTSGR